MINCSEKCIHEEEGLCTLKTAIQSSSTPTEECPYFATKEKKD